MKKIAFALVIAFILNMASGCSHLPAGDPAKEPEKAQSTQQAENVQTPPAQTPAAQKSEPVNTPAQTPPPAEETKDCDWTLHVDDTIPVTFDDGITVNYTLILDAVKKGGKEDLGTYTGSAYFCMKLDTSKMPAVAVQLAGNVEEILKTKEFTFDIVAYDEDAYSSFESKDAIAPLVEYDGMALISTPMAADGDVDLSFSGMRGEHGNLKDNSDGTYTVHMRLALRAGQVEVSLPGFPINTPFKGMLTGTPVS